MTSRPPEPPSDDSLYEIFEVFRHHVVDVSEGFERRLRQRLDAVRRDDADHRIGDVVASLFVEVFNLFGGAKDDPSDSDE